ncbi:class F sortase [Actinoplanes sp. L3-i22]|uniref:class F sortase n=1 Tax=Actinoplanes sp. L3-i22 TaxID=2836373 RepID=UPI001C76B2F9|nr:class F sortase [Actinoplanes sp. L3-i22]BCY07440.1 class F sortase [Actinoplanes sp. L3-i22]
MSLPPRSPLRIRNPRAAAFSLVLAVLGATVTVLGLFTDDALPPPEAAALTWDNVPAPSATTATRKPAAKRGPPTRLDIAAIGVHTPITAIGLRDDGTLDTPPLRSDAPAGWYRGSPAPGDPGPAIVVGHVDTARDGPAVFFRLRELKVGDTIAVRRSDRTVVRFTVVKVASYLKKAFPSEEVYGSTPTPSLRLITCGGSFDRDRGSYRSNIVVFATATP